ncbi:MAG TPA: hypothetical protein VKZ71_03990 [Burkholderiaceae bacterium]|nr:hypothetical protein [Burkholderiaceae bacterium]
MASFLPALKVALPYISQIVTAAAPMFTSRTANGKSDELVAKQIQELQSAVTQNAESVKLMATQWKDTMESLDTAAARLQKEVVVLRRVAYGSAIVAVLAVLLALVAITGN